ncbi:MAG TPA: magnesium transporter [Longimicrobium sp.]|jgi:magnesium transporter|nr:magnesium transporter [Longimicrobium sp.]
MMAVAAYDDDLTPLELLRQLLEAGDDAGLRAFLDEFSHGSDLADLLEELDEDDRVRVLGVLAPEDPALAAEALAEMEPEEHPEESLAALEPEQIAAVVAELSDDDAADMIGEMDPEDRDRVLAALSHEDAGDIRDLMRYDEESAGGIMTTELVVVPLEATSTQAIDEVRRQAQEVENFHGVVFVVDEDGVLMGTVSLQSLVTADPGAHVRELTSEPEAAVLPETDQEEVGRVLSRYNLTIVPVVDGSGRLLGGVTFDDVIDVIEAETTEDILKFGGVSGEEELRGGWLDAVRSRLPWLLVNLCTAAAGATVVLLYESTIDRLTYLAVLMPMVAGLGGNSGTQALAVTIRRLSLSRETTGQRWSVVGKEFLVGLGNGLVIALIVSTVAVLLEGDLRVGMVVMLAMWMNLTVGSFAGAFVPIVLERLKVDPAVASSIFVTAFTDMCGFFLLLGLASRFLL